MVLDNKNKSDDRNSKKFRDAILFEEILSSNKDITLYDCKGFIYKRHSISLIALIFFFTSTLIYVIYTNAYENKLKENLNIFCTISINIMMLKRYHRFQKTHVDKIVYHSSEKKFTLHKKGFFGKNHSIKIHKNNLLHTHDVNLNGQGINYINMENLDVYGIGYNYAWVEKEFFAYLIGQTIIA